MTSTPNQMDGALNDRGKDSNKHSHTDPAFHNYGAQAAPIVVITASQE